jgi:hypothetical protein
MIILHHQFKNALLYLSEQVQKELPDRRLILETASWHPQTWRFKLFLTYRENEITTYDHPPYSIKRSILGNEDVSLKDSFIVLGDIDKALEIADSSVSTMEDVSKLHLGLVRNYFPIWEIHYSGRDKDNNPITVEVELNVEENKVISSKIERF